jgi:hypothetical protein
VRPLIKMTGERGFNEVLFEDVEISDSLRLDAVGKGWTVAMTTLTYERGAGEGAGGGGGGSMRTGHPLFELARATRRDGRRAADDPVTRDALMQLAISAEGMHQNARRSGVPALCDHPMRLPLQSKLTSSEHAQRLARLGVEIAGARASLYKLDPRAPNAGHWRSRT